MNREQATKHLPFDILYIAQWAGMLSKDTYLLQNRTYEVKASLYVVKISRFPSALPPKRFPFGLSPKLYSFSVSYETKNTLQTTVQESAEM